MAQGIQEVFTLTHSGYAITVQVTLKETWDIESNTSAVEVDVQVKRPYSYYYPSWLTGSIKLDGESLVTMNAAQGTHYVSFTSADTYCPVTAGGEAYASSPWRKTGILHAGDGTGTLNLELTLAGKTASGGMQWSVSTSRQIRLTTIPRASLVAATDANIGAVSMVAVTRRSTAYTHSVAWEFGALGGYLTADGATTDREEMLTAASIPFALPEAFYYQIPESTAGKCTLTCRTYRAGVLVGEPQTAAFTVAAPEAACKPVISGTVVDSNPLSLALTGDGNTLIRHVSHALCTVTAQAQKGASILQTTVDAEPVEDSRVIENIQSGLVRFGCRDSRGYTGEVTVEKPVIPYVRLTANPTLRRTDPTSGNALLTVTGNYFDGTFGAVSNTLVIEYRVGEAEPHQVTATVEQGRYSAVAVVTGLDYRQAHTVSLTVRDEVETVEKSLLVGKGIPVFDWGEGDFRFHVPVCVEGVDVVAAAQAAQAAANAVKDSLKCYGSLTDIGITAFPTTMATLADAMPANSVLVIDTRRINGQGTASTETISDWGDTTNGVACIFRGYSNARVTMQILYGSSTAVRGALRVGNYARETDQVNWTNYGNCARLYSGDLTDGSITFRYSDHRLFVIVGRTATGGSATSLVVPREAITTAGADWMLAGSAYNVSFTLAYAGDTVTLTFRNATGAGGCITGVYGVC